MIPNAFATELSKIIAAKIGHTYLIMKLKIFSRLNGLLCDFTSWAILSTPITFDTSKQIQIAEIGIITELVKKSKKSKNCIPIIWIDASGP